MDFNMEKKQQIKSKEKAEKEFHSSHGYKITIKPGSNNWILNSDLEFLKDQSDGFNHFLSRKRFIIKDGDNAVREETSEEKSLRLKLMQSAKNFVSKIRKREDAASSQAPDDLKKAAESELSGFKNSLREESVETEKEFVETLKKAADEQNKNFVDNIGKFQTEYEPSFIKFLKDIGDEVKKDLLKYFAKDLSDYTSRIDDKSTAALEKFAAKLDNLLDDKLKTFEKKLKSAVAKADKK